MSAPAVALRALPRRGGCPPIVGLRGSILRAAEPVLTLLSRLVQETLAEAIAGGHVRRVLGRRPT